MARFILPLAALMSFTLLAGCGGGSGSGSNGPSLADRKANALRMTNPDARATELVKIADQEFAAGDPTGGRSTLDAAQRAVTEIESNSAKAATGIEVAAALAKHNMALEAKETLKKVRTAIEADTNPATKASALGRMALTYGTVMENETAAATYLGDASKLIEQIPASIDRVNALLEIGEAYQQINRPDEAKAQFGAALTAARGAEKPREQTDLLVSIANRLEKLKLTAEAAPVREEARAAAANIEEGFSRGFALVGVAGAYRTAGDATTAQAILAEAEQLAGKVADQGLRTELTTAINRAK